MNVAPYSMHTLELCAGVGMLGEGLRAGLDYLGIPTRCLGYVEREAYAAAVLAARMEEGSLDEAPVWSDLLTFDGRQFRGKVDCVVAGFPCQDLSIAGRRAGLDGARSGLFFRVLDIANDCGAWCLFLENVSGIASATASVVDEAEGELEERAAARVMGELADRGWDAEWLHVSASDVGASHGRERWFCFAWRRMDHADSTGAQRTRGAEQSFSSGREALGDPGLQHQQLQQRGVRAEHQGAGGPVVNPDHGNRSGHGLGTEAAHPVSVCASSELADTSSPGRQGHQQLCTHEPDGRTDGRSRNHADQLPNFVMMNFSHPDQTTPDGQTSSPETPRAARRLNPVFVEWLMGWPSSWTSAEPRACGAEATALWRRRLRQHLSCCLGEQEGYK